MSMLLPFILLGLFIAGLFIAQRFFTHPLAVIFGGLAIGVGLCAVAVGTLYAGCLLVMGN